MFEIRAKTILTRARRRPIRAFTLIELLVSVSIIALLISILLPSLRGARRQGKETICKTNLRTVMLAQTLFLNERNIFQALNNEENDGRWQYNYLMYDGRDRHENFGPLTSNNEYIPNVELLYCPFQRDEFHRFDTDENPWPPNDGFDTRASYARRHLLSGRPLSHFRKSIAVFSDVMHMPKVIKSAHKNGVNAAFTDGHVSWIPDPGIFTNNDLGEPFDLFDNPIIAEIWEAMDKHQ